MKNSEKYKSAKERAEAFNRFCDHECGACPLFGKPCYTENCQFYWLDLEAPAEEPLPCPFCGGKCVCSKEWQGKYRVKCETEDCWYSANLKGCKSDAIDSHNRVARAAKAKEANDANA